MNDLFATLHHDIADGITNVKGWIADVESKLPQAQALAEKYAQSPIVQALEALGETILPPGVEAEIAKLISESGKAITAAAHLVEPEQPTAAQPGAPAETAVTAPEQTTSLPQ